MHAVEMERLLEAIPLSRQSGLRRVGAAPGTAPEWLQARQNDLKRVGAASGARRSVPRSEQAEDAFNKPKITPLMIAPGAL